MTDYELSRRDALAALASAGVVVGAGGALTWAYLDDSEGEGPALDDHDRETLLAVAETVYPSEVSGIEEFVETYVVGRLDDSPDRIEGITDAVGALDEYASERHDVPFSELDGDTRDDILNKMGVDIVDPDPEGFSAERVRFHLVNELLYALYSSPTGGTLLGLENPQGYPGGTDSYQHGPDG